MKSIVRATFIAFVVTVGVAAAYSAVDFFVLGNLEAKVGGPRDNFVLGVQLILAISIAEAGCFFLLATLFRRVVLLGGLATLVAALTMAVTTILLWPPKASHPFLVAAGVSAVAFLAGAVLARAAKLSRNRVTA